MRTTVLVSVLATAAAVCDTTNHHPENGGYYIEGISGVNNSQRRPIDGRRADLTHWVPNNYYPHGEMQLCTGMFCSEAARTVGEPQYVYAHTCALLRFTYSAPSTVYELFNQTLFDNCDFTGAVLRGASDAAQPFDYMIHDDHDQRVYYFASLNGCSTGQKVAVNVGGTYESNSAQCRGMGVGSSRIRSCDCDHHLRPTTLIDPCLTGFVAGCLSDMPADTSCCPGADAYYDASARSYVNPGTCMAVSTRTALEATARELRIIQATNATRVAELDAMTSCPSRYGRCLDALCCMNQDVLRCNVASPPADCATDPEWTIFQTIPVFDPTAPTSAGSCYSMTTHAVTCDVAESACTGSWYAPGYTSSRSGCCHCRASCASTSDTCTYYDAAADDHDGHDGHDHGGHDGHDHGDVSPPPPEAATVAVSFQLSGTVETYAEGSTARMQIKQTIATGAGVATSAVALTITSASVNVAASITTTSANAAAMTTALTTGVLASASSLQTALATSGLAVTVESAPVAAVASSPSPPSPPATPTLVNAGSDQTSDSSNDDNTVVIVTCSVIGGVVLLAIIGFVIYKRKSGMVTSKAAA